MAKEEREEPDEPGCPLWMMTFGDAMSLLVTFFVMLVSFASFEEHKLQDFFGAMKGGLMAVPVPLATTVGRSESDLEDEEDNSGIESDSATITDDTDQEKLEKEESKNIIRMSSPDYYMHLLANGVSLVIRKDAIFEPGTANIIMDDKDLWQLAANLMRMVKNEIRIEATLPAGVLVRLDHYSTPWGLGIEQTLTIKDVFVKSFKARHSQVSTSVRIAKSMPRGLASEGTIEIIYVGLSDVKLKHMPQAILRGIWLDKEYPKEKDDG